MSLLFWLGLSPRRSSRPRRCRARRAADRCREARRLLLEGLEDRSLMAFIVAGEYFTGANPYDAALASIDSTAGLDLVTANSGAGTLSFLSNTGGATFNSATDSSAGGSPQSLAVGDFTGDGIPDVVTANYYDLTLLEGNGDGTFQAPQTLLLPDQNGLPQHPLAVAAGDIDGDGFLDLAVGSSSGNEGYANVLLGNDTGGFAEAEVHLLGSGRIPRAIAIGDIDGGGDNDVITSNYYDLSVLLGDGLGGVGGGSPLNSGVGFGLRSISLGDVDSDGDIDTIMSDGGYGLVVQKGNGDGTFTPSTSAANTGNYVQSAVMGDVNGDGEMDLVAVNAYCISGWYYCYESAREARVLLGYGEGHFAVPETLDLGTVFSDSYLVDVTLADLTGDGLPELAVVDYYQHSAIIAANTGGWVVQPSLFISDVTVNEGDGGTVEAQFEVTRLGPTSGAVSAQFSTSSLGATAGADYQHINSGTVAFADGETTQTVVVLVNGDLIDEYDQQFAVNLFNGSGVGIADAQGVATIVDNDAAPLVTINDVSKNEGGNRQNTSFAFTVSLSGVSEKYVFVSYSTANGTATVADSDYSAASSSVSIAPGLTTAQITVTVRGDKRKEADETFFVNLTGATNGTINDTEGIGTIVNDDGGQGKGHGQGNSAAAESFLTDDSLTTTRKRK